MYDQRLPIVDDDDGIWGDILRKYLQKEHYDTGTNDAANGGHKNVTIRAGTAGAGGAPLKFTSGALLTAPEIGAMEFVGDNLYITQTSGTTRKKVALYDDASGATGDIYYRNATGYFTRLAAGTASQILTLTGSPALPTWQTLSAYTSGGTDVSVADGGTGRSTSTTAYGIIAAGTTATGAHQTISPGTSGQFLKSAGASALAAFANITTADIASGTFAIGRIPTGTTSTTVSLGNHTHVKADVGLANVDNTSDANKPVSTATQTALNNLTADNLARVKKQGYQPAGSDAYYKLATFPVDDGSNYASMIINGRIGGWVSTNMALWNIIVSNRSDLNDGNTIDAGISAVGYPDYAVGCTDLVIYKQANLSHILYVRIPADSYYSYDFNYNSVQAVPTYTGVAEAPLGTDIWHLWSAPRIGSSFSRNIYGTTDTGKQTNMGYHFETSNPWAIVQKDGDDNIRIGTPTRSDHAVSKSLLDSVRYAATVALTVDYTLILSDDGKVLEMNSATGKTITINNAVSFPEGTMIEIVQVGAGQVSIATVGTSANPAGAKTRAQWSSIFIRKRTNTTWHVSGDME